MRITVEPTKAFFMLDDVMVRAWTGTDQDGNEVVALITAVRLGGESDDPRLVSIPPPTGEDARRWAAEVLSKRYED